MRPGPRRTRNKAEANRFPTAKLGANNPPVQGRVGAQNGPSHCFGASIVTDCSQADGAGLTAQAAALLLHIRLHLQPDNKGGFRHSNSRNIWPPPSHGPAPTPVKVVDHGTARKAAGDAGSGQGHSGGRLTQVVPDGPQTVHVAPARTQTACQLANAALTYAGVIPGVCHRCGIYKKGQEIQRDKVEAPFMGTTRSNERGRGYWISPVAAAPLPTLISFSSSNSIRTPLPFPAETPQPPLRHSEMGTTP